MIPVQLPEVPEPAMRELNPYIDRAIDPYEGEEDLSWYTAAQLREYATEAVRLNALPAVFVEQMQMLRDDFQKYSNGDKAVPFVVLHEAIIAALNEWDEYESPSETNSDPDAS